MRTNPGSKPPNLAIDAKHNTAEPRNCQTKRSPSSPGVNVVVRSSSSMLASFKPGPRRWYGIMLLWAA